MIEKSAFKPAWWLFSAHAQTLFPTLARRLKSPVDHQERFELADGDFVDLAWAVNGLSEQAPLVVLLHGLGGDAKSKYVLGLMHAMNRAGWRAVLMHFRGASHEPNRLPRAYHSGDTADLDALINVLVAREPHTKKAVVGISLGGNVLLKWLGEKGSESLVDAAVAISVPFQLSMVADKINRGFSRVYQSYLLRRLRKVFARKSEKHADSLAMSLVEIKAWRCFWTFDEHVTAPLHGFPHVHAYYREASSRPYLCKIKTPTLIIHALDDPFMTPDAIPKAEELSDEVRLELSPKGGHVGFIGGQVPGQPKYWLDQRVPAFLDDYL
jgi:predicted alpha/beta-fold hydrolase